MKFCERCRCLLGVVLCYCAAAVVCLTIGKDQQLATANQIRCKSRDDVLKDERCLAIYLRRFGYAKKSESFYMSFIERSFALTKFQKYYRLKVTGTLTEETINLIVTPRCGVPDFLPSEEIHRRKKRYDLVGSSWRNPNIEWCIKRFTRHLSHQQQIEAFSIALNKWARYARLTFTYVSYCHTYAENSQQPPIQVFFYKGPHGDGDDFDGSGGILAHAFFPKHGGAAHFDEDEEWTVSNEPTGFQKLIIAVAMHEFGHSLGLGHSEDQNAIMHAFYRPNRNPERIEPDDIRGIQELYGAQPGQQLPTTTTREPFGDGGHVPLCRAQPRPDAMVMLGDGYTYGFAGRYYWRMDTLRAVDYTPLKIKDNWFDDRYNGIDARFDAVFFYPLTNCTPHCTGNTFFFSGNDVWIQERTQGTGGILYRFPINQVFPGMEGPIDAATIWTYNKRAYFFKGNQYYRAKMHAGYTYPIDRGYPKPVSRYWNIGRWNSINGAIYYWHYEHPAVARTYFFRGDQYVRYHDIEGKIDRGYPKMTSVNWYGCNRGQSSHLEERTEDWELRNELEDFNDIGYSEEGKNIVLPGGLNGEDLDIESAGSATIYHTLGLIGIVVYNVLL